MQGLWYRILIAWYRLGGATQAQADWRARRALKAQAEASQRAADPRFICACGQLLVKGDRACSRCGRRQIMPFWMRRVGRSLGIRDESSAPVATFAMLATMIVGYFLQMRLSGSFSPGRAYESIMLGASVPALTLGDQPWRAVTYTMVHGGLLHIGFNSVALVQVGPMVEERFGKARFLAAWVFGAIGGALLADLTARMPMRPLVGASGAVFALIGMAAVQGHREGTSQGRQIRNTMLFWAGMTTVLGLGMSGISHAGHMGGMVVGAAIAWALPPADQAAARRRITPVIGVVAALVLVLSVAGLGRWFAAGSLPPADLPVREQVILYRVAIEARGAATVFGDDGLKVLNRARRSEGLSEADRMRIAADASAVSADWTPVRRDLLRFEVLTALESAARPATPPPPRSPIEGLSRPKADDGPQILVPVPDDP